MFTLIVSKDYDLPPDVQALDNVRAIRLPFKSTDKLLRRLFFAALPLAALAIPKFDMIDDLSQPPTLLRSTRRLLTVHDIRRLDISSSRMSYYAYKLSLWFCCTLGYRVITVSEAMAKQLSRHYPASRIEVIQNSVPAAFLKHFSSAESMASDVRAAPYILAVGHFETRKNYARLIQAFASLANDRVDLQLIIVGKDNGIEASIRKLVVQLGLGARVHLRGDISDTDLIDLYRSATALTFPSFYEGFGIPLLEAMAMSCPLILSDIDVFREIADEAALYFDPQDVEAMRLAMERLLASEELRSELADKGRKRLGKFHPGELAAKLGALYSAQRSTG